MRSVARVGYVALTRRIAACRASVTRREDTPCLGVVVHVHAGVIRADVIVVTDCGSAGIQLRCHNKVSTVALRPSPRLSKGCAIVVLLLVPNPAGRNYQLIVGDIALHRRGKRPLDGSGNRADIAARIGSWAFQVQEKVRVRVIGVGVGITFTYLGSRSGTFVGRAWLLDGSAVVGDKHANVVALRGCRLELRRDLKVDRVSQRTAEVAVQDTDGQDGRPDVFGRAGVQIVGTGDHGQRRRSHRCQSRHHTSRRQRHGSGRRRIGVHHHGRSDAPRRVGVDYLLLNTAVGLRHLQGDGLVGEKA